MIIGIEESQTVASKLLGRGRPKGSADIHERGASTHARYVDSTRIYPRMKSRIYAAAKAEWVVSGKNGGRKAC